MAVVGVDGGTTKTIALVADEQGHILGATRGGGSNWSGEDVQIPMSTVIELVREAQTNAGVFSQDCSVGVFTLAGADWPEDHTRRETVLANAGICQRVIVKNDAFGGLRAGTSDPYGMVIAAGTGLNAAVITPGRQEWAFGYFETFGGAGTIAQEVFEAVLRAEDMRGKPTKLTPLVLDRLGFPTVEAMLRGYIARQIAPRAFYTIAPLAFEAAQMSDPTAVEIIVRQGKGLAEYATAMVRRFQLQALTFDLVLAGSVFKGVGPLLADTIRQEVHKEAPFANIVLAKFEPAVGSVLLALDAEGCRVSGEVYDNLRKTVPGENFFNTLNSQGLNSIRANDAKGED
jgi:N-acetylglucosamine kinase-like BadF-type ATPase